MTDWNRDAELAKLAGRGLDGPNLILARMWIYHRDLEFQSWKYAAAKTDYGKAYATVVVQTRLQGEKSAEVAGRYADMDDAVHNAHLAYRLAEQMVTADREALRILHAELAAWQTNRADERAADQFIARNGT